jgi:glycosyltransferase involved in cell wall biosynthesis
MKNMEKTNIGLLTFPIGKAGIIPTANLLKILYSISHNISLITGNEGYEYFKKNSRFTIYGIDHKTGENTLIKIIRYLSTQLKISYRMIQTSKKIDVWIFFIGGNTLVLPLLTAKSLGKKVILALPGSSLKSFTSTQSTLTKPIKILEQINLRLTNHIILYSPNLINEWNLQEYQNKISIAREHFLDFDRFKNNKNIEQRKNLVGYIGRLSEEKGIYIFIQTIQKTINKRKDTEFFIGGDGAAYQQIKKFLHTNNLNNKVQLAGWIPHDDLPQYLNELKLLVLPSYTEGLPNIVLEAMACGTPVLTTPVGAIPDVITNEETGFIIKKNEPMEIAEDIVRILKHPDLQRIIENAQELVKKQFNFEMCVENYKNTIQEVLK